MTLEQYERQWNYREACRQTNKAFQAYRESGFADEHVAALAEAQRLELMALATLENPTADEYGERPAPSKKGEKGRHIREQVQMEFS